MTLIRPEAAALILRAHEVIAALFVILFGLWLAWLGGYVLAPLGLLVVGLGAVLALQGWRRMRFAQAVLSPGIIEVDEAQVGYMGPEEGGFLSLADLTEVRLMVLQGRRVWRLKQSDGQALLIPVAAQGAERLFDAFAALPGMDTGALVSALETAPPGPGLAGTRVVWRRAPPGPPAGRSGP